MKTMTRIQLWLAVLFTLGLPFGSLHAKSEAAATAIQLPAKDVDKRFMTAIYPMNTDASVNIVIDSATPKAKAKTKQNYSLGSVPRSILAKEKKGDGNPLKALVVGSPKAKGEVVRGRPLALVIKQTGDQQQMLLIATTPASIFGSAQSLDDIEALTPGMMEQIKAAFAPVKAPKGSEVSFATKSRKETIYILGSVISDFDSAYVKDSDKRPLDKDGNPQLYIWPGARNIGE